MCEPYTVYSIISNIKYAENIFENNRQQLQFML